MNNNGLNRVAKSGQCSVISNQRVARHPELVSGSISCNQQPETCNLQLVTRSSFNPQYQSAYGTNLTNKKECFPNKTTQFVELMPNPHYSSGLLTMNINVESPNKERLIEINKQTIDKQLKNVDQQTVF